MAIHELGQILNDGGVKTAIESLHLDPRWMLAIAVAGVITLMSAEH